MRLSPRRGLRGWMFLVLLAALCLSGCGPSTGSVTGIVTYNGSPLMGGTVTFIHTEKNQSLIAEIGEDGTYTIDKIPVGPVKIVVETKSLKPPQGGRPGSSIPDYKPPKDAPTSGFTPPDRSEKAKRYVAIPDSYASAETSGLTYTVTAGSQTFEIPLK